MKPIMPIIIRNGCQEKSLQPAPAGRVPAKYPPTTEYRTRIVIMAMNWPFVGGPGWRSSKSGHHKVSRKWEFIVLLPSNHTFLTTKLTLYLPKDPGATIVPVRDKEKGEKCKFPTRRGGRRHNYCHCRSFASIHVQRTDEKKRDMKGTVQCMHAVFIGGLRIETWNFCELLSRL